jgi:hypothetical protein
MYEGWINWEQGIIRVPAHEPCFCKWCLDSALGKVATAKEIPESELNRDDEDVLNYTYDHQYKHIGISMRISEIQHIIQFPRI